MYHNVLYCTATVLTDVVRQVMYDTAALDSGFSPDDSKELSRNMYDIIRMSLGVESMQPEAHSATAEVEEAAAEAVSADDVKEEL